MRKEAAPRSEAAHTTRLARSADCMSSNLRTLQANLDWIEWTGGMRYEVVVFVMVCCWRVLLGVLLELSVCVTRGGVES
jgi:hypothetical protein